MTSFDGGDDPPLQRENLFRGRVPRGVHDDQGLARIDLRPSLADPLESAGVDHPGRWYFHLVADLVMGDGVVCPVLFPGKGLDAPEMRFFHDRVAEKAPGAAEDGRVRQFLLPDADDRIADPLRGQPGAVRPRGTGMFRF